jgi:predicted TIM-barrel fold metal-dependent hydrolase
MNEPYPLKIDAYSHIVPPEFGKVLLEGAPAELRQRINLTDPMWDLEERFRIMDQYGPMVQVLSIGWPPIANLANPDKEVELAKLANNTMMELVHKYPHRFVAALAHLPTANMDAALKEVHRAVKDLGMRGVQIHTTENDRPIDSPEFMPLYEAMAEYDLPVFIHPITPKMAPATKYKIAGTFGWPYESTVAMTHLVFSGIMERFPDLKIVTHHCGGMVPFFAERIKEFYDLDETVHGYKRTLKNAPIKYFQKFYADTAIYGNTPALMCAFDFFGAEHLLFGVDMPLGDSQRGHRNYRQTINAIEQMTISNEDKKNIYQENARNLMHLPI